MPNNDYPRLCGGVFFTLILQDIKQRISAREHYKGESDGLSDPDILIGLITVIDPDYVRPTKSIKSKVNDYKSCKQSKGKYLPFGNSAEVQEFDNRVRTSYQTELQAMTKFVQDYLEIGSSGKREYKLIKALLDLIDQDKSIKDESSEAMYVSPDGKALRRSEIVKMQDIHLPALLLGIWHFCNTKRQDNSIGAPTYDEWCPENGGGPREYKGHMGEKWTGRINLLGLNSEKKYVVSPDDNEPEDENIESEVIEETSEQWNSRDEQLNQFLANPRANVHYGTGDIITDNDNMTIIKNYYGGNNNG